jgi:restriction endonuclease S subunit
MTLLSEYLYARLGLNYILLLIISDSWKVYSNLPVLLFALKYMHFLLVNLLARFLISSKARYTSFVLFVLSNFTYIIRLALHETTRKYLKPYTNAK